LAFLTRIPRINLNCVTQKFFHRTSGRPPILANKPIKLIEYQKYRAYSAQLLRGIFIHEAFHAKLRQVALANFGTDNVAAWPTPIDNITQAQLLNYYEAAAKANQAWNYIGQEWMTANIDSLAASLQEFVQTFYPSTADSVGPGLAPYEALIYMGLQRTHPILGLLLGQIPALIPAT
jgi:hypothetical protein